MRTFQLVLVFFKVALILRAQNSEANTEVVDGKLPCRDVDLVENGAISEKSVSLEALCRNEKIKLFRLSQASSLVEQSEHVDQRDFKECFNITIPALKDFQAVVKEDEHHICTMRKVELYEGFYYKYLNSSLFDKDFVPLTISLRMFVLAYGMQLANACKWNIVNELKGQTKSLLGYEDFEKVAHYIHKDSPIVRLVGSTQYPDELFLPIDLLGPELAGEQSEWVMSRGAARQNLESLKERCERRFQPIYEPLMMPVARLARLGFNYRDERLKEELNDPKTREEVGVWPRVVFLCELVRNIKLMSVELIESEAEADELRAGNDNVIDLANDEVNSVSSLDNKINQADAYIEPVTYESKFKVSLSDQLIEPNDQRLLRAVTSFWTFLDTSMKLRLRQLSNFLAIVNDHLKHFRFRSIIAKLVKYFWRQQDFWFGIKNKNDEIIKGLEAQLDPNIHTIKRGGENLTQPQKYMRYIRKGLYLSFKTTSTAIMLLLTFCFMVC